MNRRDFIKLASFSPVLGPALSGMPNKTMKDIGKIRKIELYPARYPMAGYFKFFAGPDGSTGRACVTIRVVTDAGYGWGQSVPIAKWSYETLETATVALRDYYAPALIGHEAGDIRGAHEKMDAAIASGFSTGMPITRAGIDIALWDLAGRSSGKSVTDIWGLQRGDPLALSWTLNVRKISDIDKLVDEAYARGYRNFNIKVAPDLEFDTALAKAARKAAPDGFLWADANGGYDVDSAMEAAPVLADAGVDILEAPLKPNQIRGYQKLKKQAALPIYMDEGVVTPTDLEEFIALGMLDGLACKPARCGGLSSNKAQIEIIRKHGLNWVGSGLTDPDISLAACLHLYTAFGLKKPAALNGPQFLTESILVEPIQDTGGKMACPAGPGLGIEVDENKLEWLTRESGFNRITIGG